MTFKELALDKPEELVEKSDCSPEEAKEHTEVIVDKLAATEVVTVHIACNREFASCSISEAPVETVADQEAVQLTEFNQATKASSIKGRIEWVTVAAQEASFTIIEVIIYN